MRTDLAPLVPRAAVPAVRPDPLDRLPGTAADDPFVHLAAWWLLEQLGNIAAMYRRDLTALARWCEQLEVHPLGARRHHVDHRGP